MKNQKTTTTEGRLSVLAQLCNLIPPHLVPKVLRKLKDEQGVKVQARVFKVWSHIVCLLYCHFANCVSLNDICDALGLHRAVLNSIRNAVAPCRNTLSNANMKRDSRVIQTVYYAMLDHIGSMNPGFMGRGKRSYFRLPRRFKRAIRAIDSTTIELIAKCMDWAKHRRRKAAAKLHVSLDIASFLPVRAIPAPGKHQDCNFMVALCAGMKAGDIAIFDKGYIAYRHLFTLTGQGIFWVSRAKDNAKYRTLRKLQRGSMKNIISDEVVELVGKVSLSRYPGKLRLIRAYVECDDGTVKEMTFISNNFEWSAGSICELYRSRWAIETFFKEIKQTLQLHTFLGFSRNAIEWQLWSALLAYLLLRYQAWLNTWDRTFKHFFTLMKGALWVHETISSIAARYGTAGTRIPVDLCATSPYLPGFEKIMAE